MRNLIFLYSISAGSGRRAFMVIVWWVLDGYYSETGRGKKKEKKIKIINVSVNSEMHY